MPNIFFNMCMGNLFVLAITSVAFFAHTIMISLRRTEQILVTVT